MTKRVLLTGGGGFIGHHLARHLLDHTSWHLTLLDRLDESGNLNRLVESGVSPNPRTRFFYHDLRAPFSTQSISQLGTFDYIFHLAAGTHVDRSITDPSLFIQDNIVGTGNLLDFARHTGCELFLYFSTDEVCGPAPPGVFHREDSRFAPSNPYAATKAAAECLVLSYASTFKVPTLITRTMNNIGIRQHSEKMVPKTIVAISRNEPVTVHADLSDPSHITYGSRFYIDAEDTSAALLHLILSRAFWLDKPPMERIFNIVGARETSNLELVRTIARLMHKKEKDFAIRPVDFHAARPGHDRRYALDGAKLALLGWTPEISLEVSLKRIVEWTLTNRHWL